MNKCMIIGNLTADPVEKTTQSGKQLTTFTVAVNDHGKTDFFRVTAWNGLAEICRKYLVKGRKVAVWGSVTTSAYIAKDGQPKAQMEVTAQDVEFLSPSGIEATAQKKEEGFVQVDEPLPWEK